MDLLLGSLSVFAYHRKMGKWCNIPRSTLDKAFRGSRLSKLRAGDIDIAAAKQMAVEYADEKFKKLANQTANACDANMILSPQEEDRIVDIIRIMAATGRGLSQVDILEMINILLKEDITEQKHKNVTHKVVYGLMKRRPEIRTICTDSLDVQRAADQASEGTRDAMFVKLKSYISIIHASNIVDSPDYNLIPREQIYNMDELGVDTTKHRNKIFASSAEKLLRLFSITPKAMER